MYADHDELGPSVHVHVRALAVHDNGNGTFTLKLPARKLSEAETKALESLFPNLHYQAEKLLRQEAMLSCEASESDLCAPAKKGKGVIGPAFASNK